MCGMTTKWEHAELITDGKGMLLLRAQGAGERLSEGANAALTELGAQGWEPYAVTESAGGTRYFLKRPVGGKSEASWAEAIDIIRQ